jgi:hypothetical protein
MCAKRDIDLTYVRTIFRLVFGTAPKVWYFLHFILIKGKNIIRRDQRKKYHSARSKEKISLGEIKGKNVIR